METADGVRADAPAFKTRIANPISGKQTDHLITVGDTAPGYRSYLAGTIELNAYSRLWMGHAHDDAVKAVWFDRAFLVPVK